MRQPLLLFILALIFSTACNRDDQDLITVADSTPETVTFSFEQGSFNGITLPYRKASIAANTNGKTALVLYLHGGSSKGDDNTTQMEEKGIDSITNYLVSNNIKSIFIVPQCPIDKSWGGPMNGVLKALINNTISINDIDTNRIYIFGGSMGGTGTWSMVSSYPHLFAAAMPVAGNPSNCNASNISQTPIFTVMGTADQIMSISTVTSFINQLTALGGECIFETEEGWTHEITCIQSYTTRRLAWVINHTK